jgi:hypothetical protein
MKPQQGRLFRQQRWSSVTFTSYVATVGHDPVCVDFHSLDLSFAPDEIVYLATAAGRTFRCRALGASLCAVIGGPDVERRH